MLLMAESNFIFSLYSNDVIYIEIPDTITLKSVSSNDTININHGYFLRGNVKIKSGAFEIATLDKQYIRTSIPSIVFAHYISAKSILLERYVKSQVLKNA